MPSASRKRAPEMLLGTKDYAAPFPLTAEALVRQQHALRSPRSSRMPRRTSLPVTAQRSASLGAAAGASRGRQSIRLVACHSETAEASF